MCGPCARKSEMDEKTKFCTEGCCTPKTFSDIWWGIWCFFIALQIIGFFMVDTSLFQIIGLVINVLIVGVYVMSLLNRNEVKWRSILSYIADISFGFGCAMFVIYLLAWLFGGAAIDATVQASIDSTCEFYGEDSEACQDARELAGAENGVFFLMLIGAIIFGLWLWLAFWAACQVRESVFRMAHKKGEEYDDGNFNKV